MMTKSEVGLVEAVHALVPRCSVLRKMKRLGDAPEGGDVEDDAVLPRNLVQPLVLRVAGRLEWGGCALRPRRAGAKSKGGCGSVGRDINDRRGHILFVIGSPCHRE